MATKTKKRTTKKSRETKATQHAKKQMWAVVLFALGILLAALIIIEGESLWWTLHWSLFGFFSWSSFFLPPLLIYIAVIAALDKPLSEIRTKLIQVLALIFMIAAAIQIFGPGYVDRGSVVGNFKALFNAGVDLDGGGVAGALLGYPLLTLAGSAGAKIIIVLAIIVFLMLVTGSTLISLYHTMKKPIQTIESTYVEAVEHHKEAKMAHQTAQAAAPPKFNIDVDISDDTDPPADANMPDHPVIAKSPDKDTAPPTFDNPVEYISPDEFITATPKASEPVAEVPSEPLRASHPLDDEIIRAEASSSASDDIDSILNRFLVKGPVEEPTSIPVDLSDAEPPKEDQALVPVEYKRPPIKLLKEVKGASSGDITEELKNNAQTLVDTLKSFGVQTRIIDICRGPAVTRYELQPSAGVKISKITGLANDIALNLAAASIRIEAPIPNKSAVGIEVPNKAVSMVSLRSLVDSQEFADASSNLSVALGKDIAGKINLADLAKMPHLLIAGSTGSGKSVCINSIIISLLYKASPNDVKLLMVDPKLVELGIYNGIPHLLVPVVTDPKKAAGALGWAVTEMLNRYKTFADNSVRDLAGYNRLAQNNEELQPMPQIVIIIDELSDLMSAAPRDVEDSICRLAQMARAAGMHLVIATQRPSVDVITGVIKANIPSRVAFAVSSAVDSRTILDMGGAEKLLGRGDMLYYPMGSAKPVRIQGCLVTDSEVEKVVEFVKAGAETAYDQNIEQEIDRHAAAEKQNGKDSGGQGDDEDDMLPQAIECVVEMGQASTSSLQRRLKLGYARAARIIDQLEQKGIVGPFEGSKPRQVLISKDRWMEMKLSGAESAQLGRSETPFPEPDTTGAPFEQ